MKCLTSLFTLALLCTTQSPTAFASGCAENFTLSDLSHLQINSSVHVFEESGFTTTLKLKVSEANTINQSVGQNSLVFHVTFPSSRKAEFENIARAIRNPSTRKRLFLCVKSDQGAQLTLGNNGFYFFSYGNISNSVFEIEASQPKL